MKVKTIWMPIIVIVIFIIGIGGTKLTGTWEAESDKVPITIKEGEFAGLPDPNDIRGSYSFGDIESAFDVPAEITAKAFGIESDRPSEVLAKDIEAMYPDVEVGTGALRAFVGIYTGLPFSVEDGLPDTVRDLLIELDMWTEELESTYKDNLVILSDPMELVSVISNSEDPEEHEEEEGVVKGKTTAAEVIDWGLSLEEVESIVGGEIENVHMTIRDICGQYGTSFGEVKIELNELLLTSSN